METRSQATLGLGARRTVRQQLCKPCAEKGRNRPLFDIEDDGRFHIHLHKKGDWWVDPKGMTATGPCGHPNRLEFADVLDNPPMM